MKQLNKYILEKLVIDQDVIASGQNDVSPNELKKMIRTNGFSITASFKFDKDKQQFIYSARRGHRGDGVLRDVRDKLVSCNWKLLKEFDKDNSSPDGSSIEYLSTCISPDKKVVFHTSRYFGVTSDENMFSGEFETTENFIHTLTMQRTMDEMSPTIRKIGLNDWPDNFKNYYTYKKKIYSWEYERVEKYLGKSNNNTWETNGFIITCKQLTDNPVTYDLTITYKDRPDKVELKLD